MPKILGYEEVDAIGQAIIGTEKEIAGDAWGNEDTDALDDTGNRALEAIGEGLEGQVEDDDDAEGDGTETETEAEGEEGETEGEAEADGTTVPAEAAREQPEGRVPPSRYREAAERARLAEAERDTLRQQLEARVANPELETLKAQVSTLTQLLQGKQQPQAVVEPTQPKKAPDIFEDPQGFTDYITQQVQSAVGSVRTDLRQSAVATSFELAHIRHQDAFPKAMDAINKLNPASPEDRAVVQRIYSSPNPGEALVSWHNRHEALSRVGNDPAAYEARIREETRQALLNDPEFKKQLLADMRGEALRGDDGQPRTTTRLPKSLSRAGGSNLGVQRSDPRGGDDSDQAVAESAWR